MMNGLLEKISSVLSDLGFEAMRIVEIGATKVGSTRYMALRAEVKDLLAEIQSEGRVDWLAELNRRPLLWRDHGGESLEMVVKKIVDDDPALDDIEGLTRLQVKCGNFAVRLQNVEYVIRSEAKAVACPILELLR